ncbi:MAG: translocation protein TolB [Verrucomicrobiales bacterium]|nr:translocation protein TolB [Verrucomicrobiales bacterium]
MGNKPTISRLEPRGLQRGIETTIKLTGTNLTSLSAVKFSSDKITAEIVESKNTSAVLKVKTDAHLPRAAYDLAVVNSTGESAKLKIYVDNLPVLSETKEAEVTAVRLPIVFWGELNPATDSDLLSFEAKSGQTIVFDLSGKTLGSKANTTVTLLDAQGNVLGNNNSFDGADPLLIYSFAKTGTYRLRVSEETISGSADHFYRLSMGELPEVVSVYPLSVAKGDEAEVELVGYNLPAHHTVKIKADKPGETEVPIDLEQFRARRALKVLVTEQKEIVEAEPNNSVGQANKLPVPGVASGRIWTQKGEAEDVDLFQFTATKGQHLVLETDAARRGSPLDTKLQILHTDGSPVESVLLQSVRDSQINFRPVDSVSGDVRVENWQEMELNELMYLQGEVCKIFRMPEGPDSGFKFYVNGGKRLSYFNTSPTAHSLDEPCYIVEAHPPGTKLHPNGLPFFTLYYENDDDGERKLGTDSRIQFDPPADGTYLVRVSNSRELSGERFSYRLIARETAPDFKVTLNSANPTVGPGSGQEFSVSAERIDGFAGEVRVEISGMPPGFLVSTPLDIQAGHPDANGTINAAPDAKEPTAEQMAQIRVTATATVNGKKVVKEVNRFGQIKVGEKPKLMVSMEPYQKEATNWVEHAISDKPTEITIAPGQIVPVWLKLKRNGHEELVSFTVEDLPHGVIVDNIGLSGVLIPKGENERQIFLKAAKWVPDTDRIVYCQAKQAGTPTSLPVLVHVRRGARQQTASAGN